MNCAVINHTLPTGSPSKAVPNAFVNYVGKTLTEAEKLAALEHMHKPRRSYKLPVRMEYGKHCSINPVWLERISG